MKRTGQTATIRIKMRKKEFEENFLERKSIRNKLFVSFEVFLFAYVSKGASQTPVFGERNWKAYSEKLRIMLNDNMGM